MLYAKYRLSDNQFLCVWSQRPDYDPAMEAVQAYPEHLRPDIRLHRFDGTAHDLKRLATAQELSVYDAARLDEAALADTTNMKALKAMALVTMAYCNALKNGTYVIKTAQDVRQDLITAWKQLP